MFQTAPLNGANLRLLFYMSLNYPLCIKLIMCAEYGTSMFDAMCVY